MSWLTRGSSEGLFFAYFPTYTQRTDLLLLTICRVIKVSCSNVLVMSRNKLHSFTPFPLTFLASFEITSLQHQPQTKKPSAWRSEESIARNWVTIHQMMSHQNLWKKTSATSSRFQVQVFLNDTADWRTIGFLSWLGSQLWKTACLGKP